MKTWLGARLVVGIYVYIRSSNEQTSLSTTRVRLFCSLVETSLSEGMQIRLVNLIWKETPIFLSIALSVAWYINPERTLITVRNNSLIY